MKNIAAINGSPKAKESVSGMLIEKMEQILNTKIDVYQATKLTRLEIASETIAQILKADILLIVFPLYVDSLPAPLINLLLRMEQTARTMDLPLPVVYGICNCGFYEPEHTRLALRILRNFSLRARLTWGYGIGLGCGGFMQSNIKNMDKGPTANVYAELNSLGQEISGGAKKHEDVFVTPKIPRFLYKMGGQIGWLQLAGKNKARNQLGAKPHSL